MGRPPDRAKAAELDALVAAAGDEVLRRDGGKWTLRCARGHEWTRRTGDELDSRRRGMGCRQCRIDAEAEAAIVRMGDAGPPCMDCWERPSPPYKDVCRLCRSRQGRRTSLPRRPCADGCGSPARAGWTRCLRCLARRREGSGREFRSVEGHRRHLEETARRLGEAAARYAPCPCGRRIGERGAVLVDPSRGWGARGTLSRAAAAGWPEGHEAGCPLCWPKCRRCGDRARRREMAGGACPACAPEARREEGEAAARRAALLAEREAWKEHGRLALEEKKQERARRKASGACLTCGRPTRHLGRTRCDACRDADPGKSAALKVRAMEAYGGRCSSCGCSVLAFLRIDHIGRARPDGAPRTGPKLWGWLEANGWPRDHFRCLCSNCNQALEYYGYLPADGRPPEWDHAALLARINPARVAARTMELCARLEALRASEGLSITKFARVHGLSDGVVMSVVRTASVWTPPAGVSYRAGVPKATMFIAKVLRKVEAALGMAGRLCKSCGEEMPPEEFGAAKKYKGRYGHLARGGKYKKDMSDHCRLCRRARRLKDRLTAIDKYGGICQCCGEAAYEFLAVDHVGGVKPDGMPIHGDALYHRLAAEPKRDDYRVLCHQCNFAYFVNGQRCPHQWLATLNEPLMFQANMSQALIDRITSTVARARTRIDRGVLADIVMSQHHDAFAAVSVGPYAALVDANRLSEVERFQWRPLARFGTVYAIARSPDGEKRTLYMHRLLASAAPDERVRHVDGNGLNNIAVNLQVEPQADEMLAEQLLVEQLSDGICQ